MKVSAAKKNAALYQLHALLREPRRQARFSEIIIIKVIILY